MQTITTQAVVSGDQKLKLELACDLPPGPVDVVVVVQPRAPASGARPSWAEIHGLGKDVWQGVDAIEYVRELRADRESSDHAELSTV